MFDKFSLEMKTCLLAATTAVLMPWHASAQMPVEGGKLTVAVHADMPIPDPAKVLSLLSHTVMKHVCEALVTTDDNYEIIPQLAESYAFSDENKVLTFKLRSGVKFHDGSVMSAQDVKYSLDRAKTESLNKSELVDVKSVEVVDPLTVKLTLAKASPVILTSLASPFLGSVMPKDLHITQGGDVKKPICTGPFEYVDWKPDSYLTLKKFAGYVPDSRFEGPTGLGGKRTAYLNEITFRVVPDRAARVTALETGEVDFASKLDALDVDRLAASTEVTPIEVETLEWVHIWLNVNKPPFNKVEFRRAIASAINYGAVQQIALNGKGFINASFMHPSQKSWRTPNMEKIQEYNPAKTKELLAAAGYKGEPVEILATNSIEYIASAALAIQNDLNLAGIKTTVKYLDMPGLSAEVFSKEPKYDIGFMTSSGRFDPDQHYARRLQSTTSLNKWNNPAYDALIEKGKTVMDHKERLALYDQAQQIVLDDVPLIILFNPVFFEAERKSVHGFKANAIGINRYWNVWKK
jgi:peptide/nickel transport system substrate-binding protein